MANTPSQTPEWIQKFTVVVSIIGLLPSIGIFLYTLYKEWGRDAMRKRVLEQSKSRMDIWKVRIDIHEKTLSKEKFELAKDEANEMLETIRHEANENLVILSQSRSPTPVIGIPRWRKLLLLYKPMEGNRVSGYIARIIYLLSLSPLLLYMYLPFYLGYLYFSEPKANRAADLYALFHSHQGRTSLITLAILLVVIITEASIMFNAARRERPPQKIKEIDRI